MGWAALGGFEAVLVDNGGPYRSRLDTISAVLLGGAACGLLGSLVPSAAAAGIALIIAMLVTAVVCFGVTYARVAAQPIANTSVIILVLYFAGFGSSNRTPREAFANVAAYVLGGVWAALLSLVLWPLDPFRPARLEVAACYDLLATYTESLRWEHHDGHDDEHAGAMEAKRRIRAKLESAKAALTATPARAPARTVRARNLSVLLESADMLFAATVRLTELSELADEALDVSALEDVTSWLSRSERAIARALQARPADRGRSFGVNGSHRLELIFRRHQARANDEGWRRSNETDAGRLLITDEREALQNVEIALDAVQAVWTGVDLGAGRIGRLVTRQDELGNQAWRESLVDNWTLDSRMLRHALRMGVVGAVDVLLMRFVHVTHGFWLAMTSIIVLQPYSAGTLRKGLERVGGTIAGGFLAALLAASIHSYTGITVVITACSVLTLATYAVDYGWYSFFLTPTFVLMSLPYLRDWRYAGVRIVTTILGASTAVVAMRLLWPQSLNFELSGLLANSLEAAIGYVQAVVHYWGLPDLGRVRGERELLAPARRACGLASQEAEEALDRAMLEPLPTGWRRERAKSVSLDGPQRGDPGDSGPEHSLNEGALTITTYIRRFTQCLTTLAAVGSPDDLTVRRMGRLLDRLKATSVALRQKRGTSEWIEEAPTEQRRHSVALAGPDEGLAEQMLSRMERQAGVLERAVQSLVSGQ